MDESRPIFLQVAELIEAEIVAGVLPEGGQAPSTTEIAAFHRINPATALKGVTMLVDAGILVKRRGVGMFVTDGARERLLQRRRETFGLDFIAPLIAEADAIGISNDHLISLIRKATAR